MTWFITSGPIVAMVLEGTDAVRAARQVIGATDPLEAASGSIRGDFALQVGQKVLAIGNPFGLDGTLTTGIVNKLMHGPTVALRDAAARPGGLAMGPDGSLYITEDMKGRIWRVMHKTK